MLTTAVVVYALDHISKWLVSSHVVLDTQVPAGWPVTIHYIQNSGAAFGLFPQFDYLYLVVAAVVAGYILLFGPSMGGGMLRLLALGCILGGSISNGVDRLVRDTSSTSSTSTSGSSRSSTWPTWGSWVACW